jgi:hypothetical protein
MPSESVPVLHDRTTTDHRVTGDRSFREQLDPADIQRRG